jgi:hypothetical protein
VGNITRLLAETHYPAGRFFMNRLFSYLLCLSSVILCFGWPALAQPVQYIETDADNFVGLWKLESWQRTFADGRIEADPRSVGGGPESGGVMRAFIVLWGGGRWRRVI